MARYGRRRSAKFRPSVTSGHVYYVRLRTSNCVYYKIGFTSSTSVGERLSFGQSGHESLIDEVLLFSYHKDAYDIEQSLHSHFSEERVFGEYGAYKNGPLCKNGQSELYAEDVLSLDPKCNNEQVKRAKSEARQIIKEERPPENIIENIIMLGVSGFMIACMLPILIAWKLYDLLSPSERAKEKKLRNSILARGQDINNTINQLKALNRK